MGTPERGTTLLARQNATTALIRKIEPYEEEGEICRRVRFSRNALYDASLYALRFWSWSMDVLCSLCAVWLCHGRREDVGYDVTKYRSKQQGGSRNDETSTLR
jgi:hypothetical protein